MSSPSVHLALPALSTLKFPPSNLPAVLPPPSDERTIKSPFAIDPAIYNGALRAQIPLTFAACYIITVWTLNAYNRRRKNKPWWVSTTRAFKAFVVVHNLLLAVYSFVTLVAMVRAVAHTLPALSSRPPLASYADALCKLQGPRGLGDAATYNASSNLWETTNKAIRLAPGGTPDATDVGRIWNEGLAFWGWIFYLSKFYEVLDTLIILARGKRSPTLQTYHHAGAMLCMWAGIRYMSPPIWLFVAYNSFIHSMMYVYFTLATLNIRIPQALKRTLTTMQIMQFLVGASYAAIHLFIKYDVPVTTAYKVLHPIAAAASTVSSSAVSLTSSLAQANTSVPISALAKRMLLRAAGSEGVAENIHNREGQLIMPGVQEAIKEAVQRYNEETVYRTEYTTVDCLDTSGQQFAIWLNLFYLAPLTVLFVRFFIRAYTHRTSSSAPKQSKKHAAARSSVDAAKGTERQVDDFGKAIERTISNELQKDIDAVRSGNYSVESVRRKVSDRVQSFERRVGQSSPSNAKKAAEAVEEAMKHVKDESSETKAKADNKMQDSNLSVRSMDTADGETSEGESGAEGEQHDSSAPNTPSKKKRNRKNKKKKSQSGLRDAAHAGEAGNASFADVVGEKREDSANA